MKGDKQRSISLKAYWADKKRSKAQREINILIARKMGLNMKGSKRTAESIEKLRQTKLNEKNPMWKGENVQYTALHGWIRSRKSKPEFCEECKSRPPRDLANISGEYKRNIDDFKWLCRKCHMLSDGRYYPAIRNLVERKKRKKIYGGIKI